jgi:hypothetical protein
MPSPAASPLAMTFTISAYTQNIPLARTPMMQRHEASPDFMFRLLSNDGFFDHINLIGDIQDTNSHVC